MINIIGISLLKCVVRVVKGQITCKIVLRFQVVVFLQISFSAHLGKRVLWWNVIQFLFWGWVYTSSTVACRSTACLVPIWLSVRMKCDFVLGRRMMKSSIWKKQMSAVIFKKKSWYQAAGI